MVEGANNKAGTYKHVKETLQLVTNTVSTVAVLYHNPGNTHQQQSTQLSGTLDRVTEICSLLKDIISGQKAVVY